ncbi:MAG TPA: hypothetical protein VK186_06535, partial [Candidatus Deferrimicrobium sp.]|nr:hypothetical protein [Candidatus Deferrimicrobium sp.]
LEKHLEKKGKPLKLIKEFASAFASIDTVKYKKPLVGIVGEIYIRCNSFANGDLVGMIESSGGEIWLAPLHEWFIYTAYMERRPPTKMNYKNMLKAIRSSVNNYYLFKIERDYYRAASEILYDRVEPHIDRLLSVGGEYVPEKFRGEAILTIGRAVLFARQGAAMVINAAPFGCMPGTLSSAILLEIKDKFKIPFLSLFYDGDLDINGKVTSLLKTLR